MSEWDVKWTLSWENFVLYMSSIPRADSADDDKPTIETKNAADFF